MKKILKIVFDTNVLVSAAIAKGKPKKLLLKALAKEFILVSSEELLEELEKVIARHKFKFTSVEVSKFIGVVRKTVRIVKVRSNFRIIKEDPDDDNVLNAAYDGKVDYVVSGDRHLLKLKAFKGIKIITAATISKILS